MWRNIHNRLSRYGRHACAPHYLQKVSLGAMAVLVVLSFAIANVQSILWTQSDWLVSTVLPAVVVDLTNGERSSGALGSLERNTTLDRAAQLKAEHMADEGYFAHYSPDGVSPWYWFDQAGYTFVHAGENLAVHFTDSEDLVDAWMASPGHRANILNGTYTQIGVGTARGTYEGFDTVFVVQLFGTPQPTAAAPTAPPPEEPETTTVSDVATAEILPEGAPVAQTQTLAAGQSDVTSETNGATDVVFSDLATTSRPVAAAGTARPDSGEHTATPSTAGWMGTFATQPHAWLQILYGVLALVVTVSLIASMIIEWRRHHPVQIAYGGGLLAAMALLFYTHTVLTGGVLVV